MPGTRIHGITDLDRLGRARADSLIHGAGQGPGAHRRRDRQTWHLRLERSQLCARHRGTDGTAGSGRHGPRGAGALQHAG
ncbi:MAG: hypothetical protein MZV64_00540 [Ignavibacteriales bacterium]|nr:hypothetical protein [Ignavibacteriales bacterium]